MSELPAEPGVFYTDALSIPLSDVTTIWNELLIARDFVRNDPLVDDKYFMIGDGFFIVKVRETLAWWNRYWCERLGMNPQDVFLKDHYIEPRPIHGLQDDRGMVLLPFGRHIDLTLD